MIDYDDAWCRELTIGARAAREVRMTVPIAGSVLRYTVSVGSHDVKMMVTLHMGDVTVVEWEDDDGTKHIGSKFSPNGETHVIVEEMPVVSANGASTGAAEVPVCGQLVIRFDNTYSMLTSKTVKFRFDSVSGE